MIYILLICLFLSGCATEYYNFKRNPDTGDLECVQCIITKGQQHTITEQTRVDTNNKRESIFKNLVTISGISK